jgi:hypothetical protein
LEPGRDLTMLGIYELGGDSLRLCLGLERPSSFVTKPGIKSIVLVCRRQPAKP